MTALDRATTVLRAILACGPVPASLAYKVAREAGAASRTLERAKQALSVKAKRQPALGTSGLGNAGRWEWALPEAAMTPEVCALARDAYALYHALKGYPFRWGLEDGELQWNGPDDPVAGLPHTLVERIASRPDLWPALAVYLPLEEDARGAA